MSCMAATVLLVLFQKKYQTKNYSAQSIEAVKELDTVLAQLAVSQ